MSESEGSSTGPGAGPVDESPRGGDTLGGLSVALVLVVAFAVRSTIALLNDADNPLFTRPLADCRLYVERAVRIAGGQLMAGEVFPQAPLYPYLLAPCLRILGADFFLGVALIQGALDSVTALLTVVLTVRLTRSRPAGVVAGLLYALGREPVYFSTKLLGSTPLVLCIMLVLLAWHPKGKLRTSRALAAGLLGGISCLLWPAVLPAVACLPLYRAWEQRRVALALAAGCGTLVAILPATAHNLAYERDPVLISAHGGVTFLTGNNPMATGAYSDAVVGGSSLLQPERARRSAEEEAGHPLSTASVSRRLARRAWRYILGHPVDAARLFALKGYLVFAGRELQDMYSLELETLRYVPAFGRLPVTFSVLAILVPPALWLAGREGRRALASTFVVAAGITAMMVLVFVQTRYKLPLFPLACTWIGAGVAAAARAGGRDLIVAMLLVLPGGAACWHESRPVPPPRELLVQLSDLWFFRDDLGASLCEVERVLEGDPGYAEAVRRAQDLRDRASLEPLPRLLAPLSCLEPDPCHLAASAVLLRRHDPAGAHRLARLALALGSAEATTRRLAAEAMGPPPPEAPSSPVTGTP